MYDAPRTISLLHFETAALLSTQSSRNSGYPFGSVVMFDVSEATEIVFFVSTIAEHYKNIIANPRVSLMVTDSYASHAPQKYGRVTVIGDAVVVPEEEREGYDASYRARFPDSVSNEIAHTFKYVRINPVEIRWIGGFGAMGWWETEELSSFERDPISYVGKGIAMHMNIDHVEALPELAGLAGEEVRPGELIELTFVSSSGFELQIRSETSCRRIVIDFSKECTDSNAVRKEFISLLKSARN